MQHNAKKPSFRTIHKKLFIHWRITVVYVNSYFYELTKEIRHVKGSEVLI